jgi:hypothetical protein
MPKQTERQRVVEFLKDRKKDGSLPKDFKLNQSYIQLLNRASNFPDFSVAPVTDDNQLYRQTASAHDGLAQIYDIYIPTVTDKEDADFSRAVWLVLPSLLAVINKLVGKHDAYKITLRVTADYSIAKEGGEEEEEGKNGSNYGAHLDSAPLLVQNASEIEATCRLLIEDVIKEETKLLSETQYLVLEK